MQQHLSRRKQKKVRFNTVSKIFKSEFKKDQEECRRKETVLLSRSRENLEI